jgi:hypothetical protein
MTASANPWPQETLLHALRRFDWFVDAYVAEQSKPDFKRIASDFESQVHAQAMLKLNGFKERYLKDVQVACTAVMVGQGHLLGSTLHQKTPCMGHPKTRSGFSNASQRLSGPSSNRRPL